MFYITMHSTHFVFGYMASDSEIGHPLPPLQRIFYMLIPIDRIAHATAFVSPVVH